MEKKYILLVFVIIGSILLRLLLLNNDVTGEEADFVKPAIAFLNTGYLEYYHSAQQPHQKSLLHPPMYNYLTAVSIYLVKDIEIGSRVPNLIFFILTLILMTLFCFRFFGKNGNIIALVSIALFSVNFYVFSSSMIIDIDVLSMFFCFGFIFGLCTYLVEKKQSGLYLAGVFFLFSLLNRFPIAGFVFAVIFLYLLFNKRTEYKIKKNYFLMGIFTTVIFLVGWYFYSAYIEHNNFLSIFIHNARLGTESIFSPKIYLGSFLLNIAQLIRLLTFPVVLLSLISIINLRKSKYAPIRMLLISSLSVFFLFVFLPRPAFGYPRYFLTAMPLLFVLISVYLTDFFANIKENKKDIFIFSAVFLSSLLILIILSPQLTAYNSKGLIMSTNLPDFIFNVLGCLPLVACLFFKENKRKVFLIVVIALTFSYSFYFDIKLFSHEQHIKEVGTYIRERTSADELVICPKAVGYYTERRFYVNDFTKPKTDLSFDYLIEYIKLSYKDRNMEDEFFWEKGLYGGINPPRPEQEILNQASYVILYHDVEGHAPETKIGNYYIYRAKE